MSKLEDACRPALDEEIEVTPDMIEGGFRVLEARLGIDVLLEADRQTVAEIYRAMVRLRAARPRGA